VAKAKKERPVIRDVILRRSDEDRRRTSTDGVAKNENESFIAR
jgi:hypothetical protein